MAANQYLTVHLPSQQEYNNVIVMGHEQGSCPILLPHPGLSPVPVVVGYQDQHLWTDCQAQQPIVEIPGALVHGLPLYRTGDRFIKGLTVAFANERAAIPRCGVDFDGRSLTTMSSLGSTGNTLVLDPRWRAGLSRITSGLAFRITNR